MVFSPDTAGANSLNAVAVAPAAGSSPAAAWAVGNYWSGSSSAGICKTDDAAAGSISWSTPALVTTNNLHGIHVRSAQEVYVVGAQSK